MNKLPKPALILAIAAALSYIGFLEFLHPVFYDPDSYYHIAVSGFIKNCGLHYPFPWAQFSIFKDSFSDKDLLLHILNLPFLHVFRDPVTAGKYALIFQAAVFFIAYAFVIRKYLPDNLAAPFLLLPLASPVFTSYLLQLRPATLANVFTVLSIYFLINRKPGSVFIVALLYSLSHISFPMLVIFAFVCEVLRLFMNKEFFIKNIYAALAGITAGIFIHPNFPHNLFCQYLNGIVVPLSAFSGVDIDFAGELNTLSSKFTVITNPSVFLSLCVVFWLALMSKHRISFTTAAWFAATNIYLCLAFFGNRYWYHANALFFIFFASLLNDYLQAGQQQALPKKLKPIAVFYLSAVLLFSLPGIGHLKEFVKSCSEKSEYMERAGRWMRDNIPPGQTIYHRYWNDAPYFIYLNPKDNYINALDPIYMFYRYPREFELLSKLSLGKVDKPYGAIEKIFKCRYGYLNKFEPLYRQALQYPDHFQFLYEDGEGAVFELR